MFSNPIIRFAVGIPIAAIIAVGLFMLMENLIRVNQVCQVGATWNAELRKCVKVDQRGLRDFLADNPEIEAVRTNRKEVRKLDKANKPPPPPKLTATKKNIDLPTPQIQGAAPTEISFDRVTNIDVGSVVVSDRDAQPVRPPNQGPLIRAIQRVGKSATCEVRLDVDERGKPYNVDATCNVAAYERAAEQAVKAAEFAPKIIKGKPARRSGVVYPFELNLEE